MARIGKDEVGTADAIAFLNANGADVSYEPAYLAPEAATDCLRALLQEIAFPPREQVPVFLFGRWRQQARGVTAHGDEGVSYRYSRSCVEAGPWRDSPTLSMLRDRLFERTGFRANLVLVNKYVDGSDSISAHSDDERDLGPAPTIHSQSFGAERRFWFRRHGAARSKVDPVRLELGHGSLLTMRHPTNRFWTHELPKAGGAHPERIGLRLNLTWRQVFV